MLLSALFFLVSLALARYHTYVVPLLLFFTHIDTQTHSITSSYRLTLHINTYHVIQSHKHPYSVCSQINIQAFTHPKPFPEHMYSHSLTQVNLHSHSLTDTFIHTRVTLTHWLINTQTHICPQVNTSLSPHAQSHTFTKPSQTKPQRSTDPSSSKPSHQAVARHLHRAQTYRAEIQSARPQAKEEQKEREGDHPNPLLLRPAGGWAGGAGHRSGGRAETSRPPRQASKPRDAPGFPLSQQIFSARAIRLFYFNLFYLHLIDLILN